MKTSYTWTYSFKLLAKDVRFHVVTSAVAQNDSQYAALSISGAVGRHTIRRLVPDAFGYADNVEGVAAPTFYDGVDANGLGFAAGGVVYNLYKTGHSLSIEYGPNYTYNITDPEFSTNAPSCYLRGTLIATPQGDQPVESLRIGDLICSATGEHRTTKWTGQRAFGGRFLKRNLHMMPMRIKWLGHRRIDCRRHLRPAEVWPVRISARAFGTAQPRRDLWLSPEHAVFVDGVLIPIRWLINGTTIVQEPRDEVTYLHVELERHDVILAEGLPCESYLDNGNRDAFANGGVARPHPDFAADETCELVWEAVGCAPLRIAGQAVARIEARLRRRATNLGYPAHGNRKPEPARRGRSTIDLARLLQPAWYLATHTDVAAAGVDAARHYAAWGRREGRLPCPEVDLLRALGLVDAGTLAITMPDVVAAGIDPTEHFCTLGWRERRRPNAYFETGWYLDHHRVPEGMNPLLHYVLVGENQGLRPGRHFDPAWYRQRYQLKPSASALAHYLKHRRTQRFRPLPTFDLDTYLSTHAETLQPNRDPYAHYLVIGQFSATERDQSGRAAA